MPRPLRCAPYRRLVGRAVQVVAAADYHHVEQSLLPEKFRLYSEAYWDSRVRLAPTLPQLRPATSAPGLRSPLPHLRRDCAHPCHICTGTGLTPATSAPGLRSPFAPTVRTAAQRLECDVLHRPCAGALALQLDLLSWRARALGEPVAPQSLLRRGALQRRNVLRHDATCCSCTRLGFVGRRGVPCRSSMRMRRAYSTRRSGRVHRCST